MHVRTGYSAHSYDVGVDDLGLGGEEDSLTTGHVGARGGCCIINVMAENHSPDALGENSIVIWSWLLLFGGYFR